MANKFDYQSRTYVALPSLPSRRSGPLYNVFPYPTKISAETIAVYIASITKPGETILDVFGGSCSTAFASLLCEIPTPTMKKMAQENGLHPLWGPRNAKVYEISEYAAFSAQALLKRVSSEKFKTAFQSFLREALSDPELASIYSSMDPKGNIGEIRHVIWTEHLRCPNCHKAFSYAETFVERCPTEFKDQTICPHCGSLIKVNDCDFVKETYFDGILGKKRQRKKRTPFIVYGETNGWNWSRPANKFDKESEDTLPYPNNVRPKKIKWGDLYRGGYHFGIDYLHDFYTKRNFFVFNKLWNLTQKYDSEIQALLKSLLLSYNQSNSTLMTRVVAKKNSSDFVLTGAQSGVLYISRMPVEKNIFRGLYRKAKDIEESLEILSHCSGSAEIYNKSCMVLDEPDNSIDFVFTDPPFGDFIPYAEINQINELWLEKTTKREDEIIISHSENKDINEYRTMLSRAFSEIQRVIKPGRNVAIVFHASKKDVWKAFSKALDESGLKRVEAIVLDKKQSSFKQVVSESVKGDPIVLLTKGDYDLSKEPFRDPIEELRQIADHNKNKTPAMIYSIYVARSLKANAAVAFDFKEALKLISKFFGGTDAS